MTTIHGQAHTLPPLRALRTLQRSQGAHAEMSVLEHEHWSYQADGFTAIRQTEQ
jgi:hypothetical protein